MRTTCSGGTFVTKGSSWLKGSFSKTSRAALNRRSQSISVRTVWSTTPPRATLIRTESGFKCCRRSRPIMPWVSAFRGTWTDTMSELLKTVSRSTCRPMKSGFGLRDQPSISFARKAEKSSAVRLPIAPMPTIPTVLLQISSPPSEITHLPSRMARSPTTTSRKLVTARPTVSSATASVEYAGTFTTEIPRFRHASMSTWLNPVKETATTLQLGCWSRISSVTGVVTVTRPHASEGPSRHHWLLKPSPLSAASASGLGICWSWMNATFWRAAAVKVLPPWRSRKVLEREKFFASKELELAHRPITLEVAAASTISLRSNVYG
mmetsp:Transcript_54359/g.116073  ORF Transcript_54359/g.116073 Transcript_54359/m.116073 type:complete len:322 (+) Transcript_54359:284-1249(+)